MKESDLFEPIRRHYLNLGCEVFSEVLLEPGGKRADIIIRDKNIITVIELKTSLSMDLLEQCYRWLGKAHYVYACVPEPKNKAVNWYANHCMRRDGIGLLYIHFYEQEKVRMYDKYSPETYNLAYVHERISPKLSRKIVVNWEDYLTEEHKSTLPGGTKGGGYITPYSQMIKSVRRALERCSDGMEYDMLVHYAKDHYARPEQSLIQALVKFESNWCEVFKRDGKTHCRLKQRHIS